jgi:signal recognition particle subunit SRP54
MVLNQLGASISAALHQLTRASSVDADALKALLNELTRALLSADVNIGDVMKVKRAIEERARLADDATASAKYVETAVMEELVRMLDPGRECFKPVKGRPNIVMFVGLQGAGKTTTVAKYAHYYQSRKWRVAMVCADTFRAGAFDQLKQNATKVRVPYYGSYTEADPVAIAREGVAQFRTEGYDLIIVDTSGRHKQEAGLFEEMQAVAAAVKPDDVVFVMDGSIGQAAKEQAAAFKGAVAVGSVIVTKLDGHAKGGGALAAVAATGSPIVFLGTGEGFDDLAPFDARRFVGKLLGKGDVVGLRNELMEKGFGQSADPKALARMAKGKFTLRDLRDQLAELSKLGDVSKVMEMIPGMGNFAQMAAAGGADAQKRPRRWMVLLDSMTSAELDGAAEITQQRALRIVRGAGAMPPEFDELMGMYGQFEKMIGGISKSGILGNEAKLTKNLKSNPASVQQHIAKHMPPHMLQQLGGAGQLTQMMKSLEEAGMGSLLGGGGGGGGKGGMGNIADMMKKLGGLGGGGGSGGGGSGGGKRK